MRIQPDSSIPIFQQIADGVRGEVAAGVHRPGDLIPSVRAQALALVVNPNTVQRAYEQLEREGLLISKKGTGMVVANGSRRAAQERTREAVRAILAQGIAMGIAAELPRLAIDKAYRDAWGDVAVGANSGAAQPPPPQMSQRESS